MRQLFSQKSKNFLLGLSFVGILCSCSGTSSGGYEPDYSESPASDSYTEYTEIEPEESQPYIEEEMVIDENESATIPYEDGELALTQEELELLEAIQREAAQSSHTGAYPLTQPADNYYVGNTNSGGYRNLETEAYLDESIAETENDIRALSQQRADGVAEGASYP